MAWFLLIIAGLLDVLWAYTMKLSQSFIRLLPSIITLVAMAVSFGLLSWSMRVLSPGTAYMVWTGIGAVGARFFWASQCSASQSAGFVFSPRR